MVTLPEKQNREAVLVKRNAMRRKEKRRRGEKRSTAGRRTDYMGVTGRREERESREEEGTEDALHKR